jgi:Tfp pilus assembly protein PilF
MPDISNKKIEFGIQGKGQNPLVNEMNGNKSLKKRSLYLGAIFIFLLTLIVYTPTLKNDFVNWDDGRYVYENANIQSLNSKSLYWMLTSFHTGNWHPLTWLSHAIDYALWGLNPFGHHLTNIIMHGLNTLLVLFLVIRLMIKGKEADGMVSSFKMSFSISTQALIVAGVTALLFGLHPLHVESVAWVAERKELLCTFFVLLSILSYLLYVSSVVTRHRWIWFITCLLLFILALMSKPMAITLPLILLLLDIYPLNRLLHSPVRRLSIVWEKIPFFILIIVSSIVTIVAQHSWRAFRNLEQLNLDTRLLNALRALVFYLEKIMVPIKLVPFYPYPTHIHWLDLQYLLSALLVLAITGCCLWMVKRRNYLLFTVWSFYVFTLLPVLGIIQVGGQAAADRYTYLPSLSIFLLIAVGVSWVFKRGALIKQKFILGGLVLVIICIFIFLGRLTIRQIRIWRNPEILWSFIINSFPGMVPIAHNNLGNTYDKMGRFNEAISEYKKALAINPNLAEAYVNLGSVYVEKGGFNEAISEYKKALAINPNFAEAHVNLGSVYEKKGRLDEAISECRKALGINPDLAAAHTNLGVAYHKKGELDEAILEYKQAIGIKPGYATAHDNLAIAYYSQGKYKLAIFHCDKAVELGGSVNPRLLQLLKPYR